MKRLPVRLSEDAISALADIAIYIAEQSGSLERALGFTDRIRKRCQSVGDVPFGGRARPELGTAIRSVPFEHSAIILYRVTDAEVEIINVLYGGRDIAALFDPAS